MEDRGLNGFASNMIKLSVSETKWSSLVARTGAFILYISIWIFDFEPEKLQGLSRNGPLDFGRQLAKTDWMRRQMDLLVEIQIMVIF